MYNYDTSLTAVIKSRSVTELINQIENEIFDWYFRIYGVFLSRWDAKIEKQAASVKPRLFALLQELRAVEDLVNITQQSLIAWDGEEDCVQEEHAVMIKRLRTALAKFNATP